MVRQGVAAEARAERDDQDKKIALERAEQDKKFAQERQKQEMKIAQEREEQQKQWAQKQKELFDQAFATTDVAKYQARADLARHFADAQQESQRYDKPPGSDDTVWEHQTYTDSHGIIWQRVTSTDSDGPKQYFVPQMPKEFTR